MECTDDPSCNCTDCELDNLTNIRCLLIECVVSGTLRKDLDEEARRVITAQYGDEEWISLWKVTMASDSAPQSQT